MALEPDTLLHKRYRIVEILGQGGMGSVYRAVDENLGVPVAVKENSFTTEEYERQFRLEAVILASLRHNNMPRVSDHFSLDDQGQYLVMDFIDGEDLRQRMERTGLISEEEAIHIGAAMCDALFYLHTRKPSIIHRDIKPGNVKITSDGQIYLVDFGLAKVVQGSQVTTTGARAMTPGYSPPEQYGTGRTDARSDIYSLGSTLYAALSGVIPEDGLARAMDNMQLTSLRKRNASISRRLANTIEKAMAVDPSDRFQDADQLKKALLGSASRTQQKSSSYTVTPPPPDFADFVAGKQNTGPVPASDKPAFDEEKPFVSPRKRRLEENKRRRQRNVFAFFVLLIAGIAGILFFAPNIVPAQVRQMIPFLPLMTATSTPTQKPTEIFTPTQVNTKTVPTVTKAPTNTKIPASATATITSATETLQAQASATLAPTESSVAWTGGGTGQIAFASNRTNIPQIYLSDVTELAGDNAIQLTDITNGACQPDWSPDGMKIVFISPCLGTDEIYFNASLYIMNADGSDIHQVTDGLGGDFDPAWSPDGTRIAFTSLRDKHMEIYILNVADNNLLRLTNTTQDIEPRQPAWSPDNSQIVYAVKRGGVYQVWLMNSSGENQEQITRNGSELLDYLPTWSPDGSTIIFNQRKPNVRPYLKMLSASDRTNQQGELLPIEVFQIEDVDYSPDGLLFVYEGQEQSDNKDILYIPVTGGQKVRLTSLPALDYDPAWRPASVAP